MTSIYFTIVAFVLATVAMFGFGFFYTGFLDTYGVSQPEDFTIFNQTGAIGEKIDSLQQKFNETRSNPSYNPFAIFDLAAVYTGVFTDVIFAVPGLMIGTLTATGTALDQYGIPGWLVPAVALIIVVFFVLKIASILLKKPGDL